MLPAIPGNEGPRPGIQHYVAGGEENAMHRRTITWHRFFAFALVAMLLLASPAAMMAGNKKHNPKDIPGVIPPSEEIFGKTQGEWSGEWWQWAYDHLLPDHPILDGTGDPNFDLPGSNCDAGQEGPVWFLAGTFGGNATRKCAIPSGKTLFFPIFNFEYDNIPLGYPGTEEDPIDFTDFDLDEITERCLERVDNPKTLLVELDGKTLKNPETYAVEPTPFIYTVPADPLSLYGGNFAGKVPDPGAVSCGYYVALEPLSKGAHKLRIVAVNEDEEFGDFSMEVNYKLQVGKKSKR
jgi:hypothetical protein